MSGFTWDHVAGYELLYVVVAAICVMLSVILFTVALRDLLAAREDNHHSAETLEAWTAVVGNALILANQLIAVVIGLTAAYAPPSTNGLRGPGLILAVLLTVKNLDNLILQAWMLYGRIRLDSALDRQPPRLRHHHHHDHPPAVTGDA